MQLKTLSIFAITFLIVFCFIFILSNSVLQEKDYPEKCSFETGLMCIDHPAAAKEELAIFLQNNIGSDIMITGVSLNCSPNDSKVSVGKGNFSYNPLPLFIPKGEIFSLKTRCSFTEDSRIKESMTISYRNIEKGIDMENAGVVAVRFG